MVDRGGYRQWKRQKCNESPRVGKKRGRTVKMAKDLRTIKERRSRLGDGRCTAKGHSEAGSGRRTSSVALWGGPARAEVPWYGLLGTGSGYPFVASRDTPPDGRNGFKWYARIICCEFRTVYPGCQVLTPGPGRGHSRICEFSTGIFAAAAMGSLAFTGRYGRLPVRVRYRLRKARGYKGGGGPPVAAQRPVHQVDLNRGRLYYPTILL